MGSCAGYLSDRNAGNAIKELEVRKCRELVEIVRPWGLAPDTSPTAMLETLSKSLRCANVVSLWKSSDHVVLRTLDRHRCKFFPLAITLWQVERRCGKYLKKQLFQVFLLKSDTQAIAP